MNLSYEEAVRELEKILDQLENGDCSLEESTQEFKRGIKLYNYCNDLITKVEGEVKVLLEEEKGDMTEVPFLLEV